MSDNEQKMLSLARALEDHSAEGIEILASEPPRLIRLTLVLIASLLLVALVWSFFGRADVIVSAPGTLSPGAEIRRFYAPIEGELVDIFIAEGQPVVKGDVIARLNARGAVKAAAEALEAELRLANARRELQRFPARKQLMERQVQALEDRIESARKRHEKRVVEGMNKLAAQQQAQLQQARGRVLTSKRALDVARLELEKFQRLFNSPGGGGVSKTQVETRRSEFVSAREEHKLAQAKFSELEFQLSSEYAEAKAALEASDQELNELLIEKDSLLDKIQYEQDKVQVALRGAELEAEAAERVKFENIDEDNFLRILAPVSGVLTDVKFTQPGDKIQAHTPLGGIAEEGARPVLKIEIPERDRAFLAVGQTVKMKFNAFAYQRYGFIEGTLEYLSPSTRVSEKSQVPVYQGRVTLERDFFEVDARQYPLRYGMQATAEIVVRKRRLIDLALDPFRNLEG